MFLGSSDTAASPSYFLPLLPVMKKRGRTDEVEKIKYQDLSLMVFLPMLQICFRMEPTRLSIVHCKMEVLVCQCTTFLPTKLMRRVETFPSH